MTDKNNNDNTQELLIEHIVIAGGGVEVLPFYGILQTSEQNNIWKIQNIKSIWGTSAGAILAVILALKHEWDTIDNYIINRPWEKVFIYDLYTLIQSISNCGIYDITIFYNIYKPLFLSKNIDIHITMQQFFNITNIDIHLITTDVNTLNCVDISHTTHPNWKVIDAVYASAAVPILFKPIYIDNILYCDGFFTANYPIQKCIDTGICCENILGVRCSSEWEINTMNDKTSLIDYIIYILFYIIYNFVYLNFKYNIGKEYIINPEQITIAIYNKAITEKDERVRLIEKGRNIVKTTL